MIDFRSATSTAHNATNSITDNSSTSQSMSQLHSTSQLTSQMQLTSQFQSTSREKEDFVAKSFAAADETIFEDENGAKTNSEIENSEKAKSDDSSSLKMAKEPGTD